MSGKMKQNLEAAIGRQLPSRNWKVPRSKRSARARFEGIFRSPSALGLFGNDSLQFERAQTGGHAVAALAHRNNLRQGGFELFEGHRGVCGRFGQNLVEACFGA